MNANQIKIATWLPLFPGFYNTIYEPDEESEIYSVNQERESKGYKPVEFDRFEFDYTEYKLKVVKGIAHFIESNFPQFVSSVEIEEIRSPREYNFANDSCNVIVTLSAANRKAIGKYIATHLDDFKIYLKDRYTSCSGFISSYPNSPEFYLTEKPLEHAHKLGSILEFIFNNENKDSSDFAMDVYYSINDLYLSCVNYHELTNPRGRKPKKQLA